jgi:hypothetical protein
MITLGEFSYRRLRYADEINVMLVLYYQEPALGFADNLLSLLLWIESAFPVCPFTGISPTFAEEAEGGLKDKSQRFTKSTWEKLRVSLQTSELDLLGIDSVPKGATNVAKETLLNISIRHRQPRGFTHLPKEFHFMLKESVFLSDELKGQAVELLLELLDRAVEVFRPGYGLIHAGEWHAYMGGIYFAGVIPASAPLELQANHSLWMEKGALYRRKVRDLYWGNYLSGDHLAALGGIEEFEKVYLPKATTFDGKLSTVYRKYPNGDIFFTLSKHPLTLPHLYQSEAGIEHRYIALAKFFDQKDLFLRWKD